MTEQIPKAWQAKIDAAVADGDNGRAVDLLEMWIRSHGYTRWALERLGALLLGVGFKKDAGRALFWAGVREGDGVEAAIAQFLRPVQKRPAQVLQTLPRQAQLPLDEYPEAVRRDLTKLGVSAEAVTKRLLSGKPQSNGSRWGDLLGVLVLLLFVAALGAVFVKGTQLLWGWCFGD